MGYKNVSARTYRLVRLNLPVLLFVVTLPLLLANKKINDLAKISIWKLTNIHLVGGYQPVVLGKPAAITNAGGSAIFFNGIDDGLVVPTIPIEGYKQFTIEVLFNPANDGPVAPRFVHFEDKDLNRGTFELRITANGQWYMDTFLKNGKTNKGLTLINSSLLHPANKWYWAAMVYDGKKMRSYVNGKKELEDTISLPPFAAGSLSLGVRLNKVNWYKGLIKEMRFHSTALNSHKLQRL
jgi:hypothetical protein